MDEKLMEMEVVEQLLKLNTKGICSVVMKKEKADGCYKTVRFVGSLSNRNLYAEKNTNARKGYSEPYQGSGHVFVYSGNNEALKDTYYLRMYHLANSIIQPKTLAYFVDGVETVKEEFTSTVEVRNPKAKKSSGFQPECRNIKTTNLVSVRQGKIKWSR